jgi:hypothetical protein
MEEPQPYIRCTVRGDRYHVARIAFARDVPFTFVKEIRVGDFIETVGKVALEYKRAVAAWFRESIGRPDSALLAYAVTTDALEAAHEAARTERIEEARRFVAACIKSQIAEAPDADPDPDQTARPRSRRQTARTQSSAEVPISEAPVNRFRRGRS